eukprot:CAMPEP_0174731652 /NCGR_PEP_ID=MMETSP1094-20130205/57928_1 /TAXON_ID=156173 /ORGANISM="Chrysochromulina brevifilum, Strain UTEX LB 985" /LENGTH=73 /DNA_ID=CAMNT_0015934063 /DNA_START=356 /DNA_END=573 /DNA_ORIENTATION=-
MLALASLLVPLVSGLLIVPEQKENGACQRESKEESERLGRNEIEKYVLHLHEPEEEAEEHQQAYAGSHINYSE